MKRLVFLVIALCATLVIKAQVFLIDDFTLSATEGAYGIYADIDCKESNVFYIDMQAPNDQQQVQMKLWSNYIDAFVKSLKSAKKEYLAWSKIAKDNNITSLSKDINSSFIDKELYFTDEGKWFLQKGVDLKCKFIVSSEGLCYMVLQSESMTSNEVVAHSYSVGNAFNFLSGRWGVAFGSSTTSIIRYCAGASLVFSSPEEIDMFIQKLYGAKEWKTNNIKQGKLLKMVF